MSLNYSPLTFYPTTFIKKWSINPTMHEAVVLISVAPRFQTTHQNFSAIQMFTKVLWHHKCVTFKNLNQARSQNSTIRRFIADFRFIFSVFFGCWWPIYQLINLFFFCIFLWHFVVCFGLILWQYNRSFIAIVVASLHVFIVYVL